jgi:hypothetical protein
LLSERFLNAEDAFDEEMESIAGTIKHHGSDIDSIAAIEAQVDDPPIKGVTDGRFYMQPNEPLKPAFTSPSSIADKSSMFKGAEIKIEPDLMKPRPITPVEPTSFLADPSSPQTESPKKMKPKNTTLKETVQEVESPKAAPKKKATAKKTKATDGDGTYRPGCGNDDDDEEWEEPRRKL